MAACSSQELDQSAEIDDDLQNLGPSSQPAFRSDHSERSAIDDQPYPQIEPLEDSATAPAANPTNNDYRYLSDPKLPAPIYVSTKLI